jgi:hypothetical protein
MALKSGFKLSKMKRKKTWKIILIVIVVILVVGQFIQPTDNNGVADGPKDIAHTVTVPPDVMQALKKSCYDCHSDHTTYPWYDRIFPVIWWIRNHINEGKREVDFTVFSTYPERKMNKKLEEIGEQVEKGEMPIGSYTFIHPDTKLTDAQKKAIIDWAKGTKAPAITN